MYVLNTKKTIDQSCFDDRAVGHDQSSKWGAPSPGIDDVGVS